MNRGFENWGKWKEEWSPYDDGTIESFSGKVEKENWKIGILEISYICNVKLIELRLTQFFFFFFSTK